MSDDLLAMVQGRMTPLSRTMGMVFTKVEPDLIEAEMLVRPDLCTTPAILHGGAMMALADNVGAVGTVVNLQPGTTTTTIESKTNFLAAVPEGQKAIATAIPLHRGYPDGWSGGGEGRHGQRSGFAFFSLSLTPAPVPPRASRCRGGRSLPAIRCGPRRHRRVPGPAARSCPVP